MLSPSRTCQTSQAAEQLAFFMCMLCKTVDAFHAPSEVHSRLSVQDDLELINRAGQGRLDVTIGSALDLFGGPISYTEVVFWHLQQRSSS